IMIPLAVAVGVLADASGVIRSRIFIGASVLLFVAQCLMLVFPVFFPNNHAVDPGPLNAYPWRIMIRVEQWDWKPLRDISRSWNSEATRGARPGQAFDVRAQYGWSNPGYSPKISYLGNGRAFNGTQIQYAWLTEGAVPPDVTWLWRYEDGQIDWQKV